MPRVHLSFDSGQRSGEQGLSVSIKQCRVIDQKRNTMFSEHYLKASPIRPRKPKALSGSILLTVRHGDRLLLLRPRKDISIALTGTENSHSTLRCSYRVWRQQRLLF